MKALVLVTLLLATLIFFGCGGDEEDETVVEVISNKTPVISVEKIRENPDPEDEMYREVWFKFTADPAPRKEMLVNFYPSSVSYSWDIPSWCESTGADDWANISKGEKESKEISISVDVNGFGSVSIRPIPTVDIVGEGKKIDMDELEREWGTTTVDGQTIPEGFQFPYYEVGENPSIILYDTAEDVEIVSIDPPDGSIIKNNETITITFSSPPYCPLYGIFPDDFGLGRVSPTTFTHKAFSFGRVYLLNVEWGQGRDTRSNQEFRYTIR